MVVRGRRRKEYSDKIKYYDAHCKVKAHMGQGCSPDRDRVSIYSGIWNNFFSSKIYMSGAIMILGYIVRKRSDS